MLAQYRTTHSWAMLTADRNSRGILVYDIFVICQLHASKVVCGFTYVVSKSIGRWSAHLGLIPSFDDVGGTRCWLAAATATPCTVCRCRCALLVPEQVPASPHRLGLCRSSRHRRRRSRRWRDEVWLRWRLRGGSHTVWRQRVDADRHHQCHGLQQPSASACRFSRYSTLLRCSVFAG